MRDTILAEIIADLGENYSVSDSTVLASLLDDCIVDALNLSNRTNTNNNLSLLKSNIKKAVKTIYLQRGVEDVYSNSQSGLSNTYSKAIDDMLQDIIKQNKRVLK